MIVVASKNGEVGIAESMRVLRDGGSAVDAVEAGIRLVEANPEDHTVGYGGYPNLLGQVELDAGIVDGRTRAAGAVGAMQGYQHAISIARKVMENLPHVFLVGQGAERFAAEMGFRRRNLLTKEAREVWERRLRADRPGEDLSHLAERTDLWKWVGSTTDPERAKGTVNFIAQDACGDICAGVSTSGWAWKYPGRLGDSSVIGAGLYAQNGVGAVACTGMGEMAIRAGTARSIVLFLQLGLSLSEACNRAMEDFNTLGGQYLSAMNLIALDRDGNHVGFSNMEARTYIFQKRDMDEPEEVLRTFVKTKRTWANREASAQQESHDSLAGTAAQ
jgi:beta-aspartyl-peptidase (threonine type)